MYEFSFVFLENRFPLTGKKSDGTNDKKPLHNDVLFDKINCLYIKSEADSISGKGVSMTIVIPAYKPDHSLPQLICRLQENFDGQILVVNDGSGKAYAPIFEEVTRLGCRLLTHSVNQGKGAAMKTAFRALLDEQKEEIICTADADGQHLPEDIFRCMAEAQNHPDSLVLGVRSFRGDVPARSQFGNTVSRWTFRLLMGVSVQDTQTGLRAFSSSLLKKMLSVKADRYEYEMQVLCDVARKKIPIRQVEIETVYLDENRSSHFNPLRDALRVYGTLLRCALGPLFQFFSFLISSGLAFAVDLISYALFFHLLFAPFFSEKRSLEFVSLLVARILSSVVNYWINRNVVFRNLKKPALTLTLYTLLAVVTFFAHEYLNWLFLITLSFPPTLALLMAQVIFFPISFLVQKYWIFPNQKEKS